MKIHTGFAEIETRGHSDIADITPRVAEILSESGLREGQVTVFASGSTAGITTIEYEPGLLRDIPEALDRIAPEGADYHHDAAWGDGNGNAHVRAALIGPSLTVPFTDGRLLLGTWQQIVVVDCDNRPRRRRIAVQLIGA
ncbi:MAG TPA: YjbQ family protein [bacterium]|nr:YjbQ family protein [bacterium]